MTKDSSKKHKSLKTKPDDAVRVTKTELPSSTPSKTPLLPTKAYPLSDIPARSLPLPVLQAPIFIRDLNALSFISGTNLVNLNTAVSSSEKVNFNGHQVARVPTMWNIGLDPGEGVFKGLIEDEGKLYTVATNKVYQFDVEAGIVHGNPVDPWWCKHERPNLTAPTQDVNWLYLLDEQGGVTKVRKQDGQEKWYRQYGDLANLAMAPIGDGQSLFLVKNLPSHGGPYSLPSCQVFSLNGGSGNEQWRTPPLQAIRGGGMQYWNPSLNVHLPLLINNDQLMIPFTPYYRGPQVVLFHMFQVCLLGGNYGHVNSGWAVNKDQGNPYGFLCKEGVGSNLFINFWKNTNHNNVIFVAGSSNNGFAEFDGFAIGFLTVGTTADGGTLPFPHVHSEPCKCDLFNVNIPELVSYFATKALHGNNEAFIAAHEHADHSFTCCIAWENSLVCVRLSHNTAGALQGSVTGYYDTGLTVTTQPVVGRNGEVFLSGHDQSGNPFVNVYQT